MVFKNIIEYTEKLLLLFIYLKYQYNTHVISGDIVPHSKDNIYIVKKKKKEEKQNL